jgi:hypothetical protein
MARSGAASYRDFLIRASGGAAGRRVLLNFGSAVMGPEVHLKARLARNVALQGGAIRNFATAVST